MLAHQYPAAEQQLPKVELLHVKALLYPHVPSGLIPPGATVEVGVAEEDTVDDAPRQGPL
jgi:hypothetical protein